MKVAIFLCMMIFSGVYAAEETDTQLLQRAKAAVKNNLDRRSVIAPNQQKIAYVLNDNGNDMLYYDDVTSPTMLCADAAEKAVGMSLPENALHLAFNKQTTKLIVMYVSGKHQIYSVDELAAPHQKDE